MPSTTQIGNLLKTKAVGWIAPVGTPFPTMNLAAGADWPAPWSKLGLTKTALKFKYEAETFAFEVEEARAPVKKCTVKRSVMFETTLAEFTIGHMALATGTHLDEIDSYAATATTPEYFEVAVGDTTECGCDPTYAIGFEGVSCDENENLLPIRMLIYAATIVMKGEMTFSQRDDDYTGIPLTVEVLSSTDGKMILFQRATAPDTTP